MGKSIITMADLLSFGWIISTLINAVVAALALIISDKFIAHQIDAKRILIMALLAMFVAPLLASLAFGFTSVAGPIAVYLVPLLVWIILGEVMLSAERMVKLKVAAVGFFVYVLLSMMLTPYLYAVIPF